MSINDINPSEDTVMTPALVRLFTAEGCVPTMCHACNKRIKAGVTFKLIPHNSGDGLRDEMCCSDCGEKELVARDKRIERQRVHHVSYDQSAGYATGGYSRPSKVQP